MRTIGRLILDIQSDEGTSGRLSKNCAIGLVQVVSKLQQTSGVYFLLQRRFDDYELVYVGASKNVYKRIGRHLTEGKKEFNEVRFYPCENPFYTEKRLLRVLTPTPKYNRLYWHARNKSMVKVR